MSLVSPYTNMYQSIKSNITIVNKIPIVTHKPNYITCNKYLKVYYE